MSGTIYDPDSGVLRPSIVVPDTVPFHRFSSLEGIFANECSNF